jgi:hypothetical protein
MVQGKKMRADHASLTNVEYAEQARFFLLDTEKGFVEARKQH